MKDKRKIRRAISVLAIICMGISIKTYAAEIQKIEINSGKITVKGISDEKNVSFKIFDSKSSSQGNQIGDVCELGESSVLDGSFLISLKMPDKMQGVETDGMYKLEVKDSTSSVKEFLFIGTSYRNTFLNDVNSKITADELFELFEASTIDGLHKNTDIMNNLGVDENIYKNYNESERKNIAKCFLNEKAESTVDNNNFSLIFNKAQLVQYINKNAISESWLDDSNLKFEDIYYSDIKDAALKKWIIEILEQAKPYAMYSDLEREYRKANILYMLNNAKYTEYDKLIEKYNTDINIADEAYYINYKNMNASDKAAVNTKLKSDISNNKVTNMNAFKEKYQNAVNNIKNNAAKNDNFGGGGGGGGSFGGSSGKGDVAAILPEKANPTVEAAEFNDLDSVLWAKDAIKCLAKNRIVAGYDDNSFRPNKNITREEFVKMLTIAAKIDLNKSSCNFKDVEQDKWYSQYVNAAFAEGIVLGVSEELFGIGQEITREDMAVIVSRIVKNADSIYDKPKFYDDNEISSYAKDAVYMLYYSGKIAGVGDNLFAPKEIVTRAQAAKIIYDILLNV